MSNAVRGILLVNLGTPSAPDVASVRRFLKAFLSDPDVITLPFPLRWLLLHLFILPFRPYQTQRAYQAIWTKEGSPLQVYSEALQSALQEQLGEDYQVALSMRYSQPSIAQALGQLLEGGCQTIRVVPLFPQYAVATTASIKAVVDACFTRWKEQHCNQSVGLFVPKLTFLDDFFDHPLYIQALAEHIKPALLKHKPDVLLMSYHGLPVSQIKRCCSKQCCTRKETVPCPDKPLDQDNRYCYRAQCYATSRQVAKALGLSAQQYKVAFQSRLGRTPWIQPYTDKVLEVLAKQGVRHVAVVCPSFITDCLETLEEIGIRAKAQWQALGGESLTLITCLNDNPSWIDALTGFCRNEFDC